MCDVVQTGPGFSESFLSGFDSRPGGLGGLFRQKKLVIFLRVSMIRGGCILGAEFHNGDVAFKPK